MRQKITIPLLLWVFSVSALIFSCYYLANAVLFRPIAGQNFQVIEDKLKDSGFSVTRYDNKFHISEGLLTVRMELVERDIPPQRIFKKTKYFNAAFLCYEETPTEESREKYLVFCNKIIKIVDKAEEDITGIKKNNFLLSYSWLNLIFAIMVVYWLLDQRGKYAENLKINPLRTVIELCSLGFIALAIYWPYTQILPQAGYRVEKLIFARQGWFDILWADTRHPFMFIWLLKIADSIFSQPRALYILSIIATVVTSLLIVYYFYRKTNSLPYGWIIAFIMMISPAFIKYGADCHPFSLWFLLGVLLFMFMEIDMPDMTAVTFILAVYTSYVAWLFLPWLLVSYKKRVGKFKRRHFLYILFLAPSLIVALVRTWDDTKVHLAQAMDNVGIVWDSSDLPTTFWDGLVYLSPGGMRIIGIIILLGLIFFAFRGVKSQTNHRLPLFLLILPLVFMFALTPFVRIKPWYFSVFFPMLIMEAGVCFWSALRDKKAVLVFSVLLVVIGFLSIRKMGAHLAYIHAHQIASIVRYIPNDMDVWFMDESSCRLFSYYDNPKQVGRLKEEFHLGTSEARKGKIHEIFRYDQIMQIGTDRIARDAVREWSVFPKDFMVVLDKRLNTPRSIKDFTENRCITKTNEGILEVYLCSP